MRALITSSSQLRKLAPDLGAGSEIQSILLTDEANDVPAVASLAGSSRVFCKNRGDSAHYESRYSAH